MKTEKSFPPRMILMASPVIVIDIKIAYYYDVVVTENPSQSRPE